MKNPQLVSLVEDQVEVDSTSAVTLLKSPWMLACGTTSLFAAMELRGISGSFNGQLRIRYASVSTQRPGAWGTATTPKTTNDVHPEPFDTSATTNQLWVQVGMAGYATAGVAECFARLQAAAQGNGMILAQQTVEVNPDTNVGQYQYVALGNPFAQVGITKLMYAVVFSGVSGTITHRPVYRQFKGNLDLPEAWVDLGTTDQTQSTDGDVNSGHVAVTPTSGYLFGQPGIKYQGTARGTLKIVVAGIF